MHTWSNTLSYSFNRKILSNEDDKFRARARALKIGSLMFCVAIGRKQIPTTVIVRSNRSLYFYYLMNYMTYREQFYVILMILSSAHTYSGTLVSAYKDQEWLR